MSHAAHFAFYIDNLSVIDDVILSDFPCDSFMLPKLWLKLSQ